MSSNETSSHPGPDEFIPLVAAARLLGINPRTVPKVVKAAKVRVKALPGTPARYCKSDIERIARESIKTL